MKDKLNTATELISKFGKTTAALRLEVRNWITQLVRELDEERLPFEQIGWSTGKIGDTWFVNFYIQDKLHQVSTDHNTPIEEIIALCDALAGPEGAKLHSWLQEQNKKRETWLEGFYAFRKATKTSHSLYDPTNPMDRKILKGVATCLKPDPFDTING